MSDFVLKSIDRLPVIDATMTDSAGVVDLTNATGCLFIYQPRYEVSAAAVTGSATILSAISGVVRFTPTAAMTASGNVFWGEFRAQFTGGDLTFPNDSYACFEIVKRLGL